jgi:hypothetical protein
MRSHAMTFTSALKDQLELLNGGDPLEAFDRYFADVGVMYDNDQLFGVGKVECRSKQEPFISAATSIVGNITRCSFDEEQELCAFRNESTFVDAAGGSSKIDGLHVQRWKNGAIIEERYYRGDVMAERIAAGILDLGQEL